MDATAVTSEVHELINHLKTYEISQMREEKWQIRY